MDDPPASAKEASSQFTDCMETMEPVIRGLQSSSHEELLNAIDRLRDLHIDKDVSIPQIVVVGDQSSGKSSVLEAIAGLNFPVGINTVTSFATEVVLRRAPRSSIDVRLRPASDRLKPASREHIEGFRPYFTVKGPEDFGRVIRAAAVYLKAHEPQKSVWNDVLRVEISGPDQIHLTLVDLPGLVHADIENRNSGDERRIRELVSSYLRKPRTIVLAVVSALYDLQLQEVIKFVRSSSAVEERTLAIITKPDRLEAGSDDEKAKIKLAKGETIRTGYGWHVLRNLPHEDADRSAAHRDAVESTFFAGSAWSRLTSRDLGVHSLREKLGQRLFGCIISELPALLDELKVELKDRQSTIERLGPARATFEEQRRYLSTIMSRLHRLTEAALDGDYDTAEFVTFFNRSDKRLRAAINDQTDHFADDMRRHGAQYHIHHGANARRSDCLPLPEGTSPNFFPPYVISRVPSWQTYNVPLDQYCTTLSDYIGQMRGRYLPGTVSPKLITAIFRQQSAPWEYIARRYVESCYDHIARFLEQAVVHAAGKYTADKLMERYFYPALDKASDALDSKVNELLWPYQKSHPMTANPRYRPKKDRASSPGDEQGLAHTTGSRVEQAQTAALPSSSVTAAEALDRAEMYYEIALDTFVDNCVTLAIEAGLLDSIAGLFERDGGWQDEPGTVSDLGGESTEAIEERKRAEAEKCVLQEVIGTCRKCARQTRGQSASEASDEQRMDDTKASVLPSFSFSETITQDPASGMRNFTSGSVQTPRKGSDAGHLDNSEGSPFTSPGSSAAQPQSTPASSQGSMFGKVQIKPQSRGASPRAQMASFGSSAENYRRVNGMHTKYSGSSDEEL
ncbi:hypothetical protein LTR56_014230 [Elasticomyces elasticus]|nr:hypothetical protein LTR56_014230 [Elasticomyces elasticus]KAK3645285.1 hypothetical protein LTR22_014863 [Elasticomyces elasticus]KAK4917395.1 hypothetical protein LTR49_014749 [Elasticomyces elasticus]KAK5755129.1 hypothetical protein LTS12_014812 [Elasticomyces elasticus]